MNKYHFVKHLRITTITLFVIVTLSCSRSEDSSRSGTPMEVETVQREFIARELDIWLDEHGRPYDVQSASAAADRIDFEAIGGFFISDGKFRVMDGNAIQVNPYFFRDEATAVDFSQAQLEVEVVWEVFEKHDARQVLAIVVSIPQTAVTRWSPLEHAYSTDGGVGGFTSASVVGLSRLKGDDYFIDEIVEYYEAFDLDKYSGRDTLIFANGSGDGGYPLSRGFDADGRMVSVVIIDNRYPWRLIFPDAEPPTQIIQREDELAECLAGRRPVEIHGDGAWNWCTSDL